MPPQKRSGFWVAEAIALDRSLDNDELATLVRLVALLRGRRLRGGQALLTLDDVCEVAGQPRIRAIETLLALPRRTGLPFEVLEQPGVGALLVSWPKALELRAPGARRAGRR